MASPRPSDEFSSDEASLERKIESLSVCNSLVRNISQKFKKKKKKKKRCDLGRVLVDERTIKRPSSSNFLGRYIKGAGCSRVVSCEEIDINGKKTPNSSEICLPIKGIEKKRNSTKMKAVKQCLLSFTPEVSLPDDVLEMILARVSLRTLIAARVVCKRWNQMIVSPQFAQLRSKRSRKDPWFFLFGSMVAQMHVRELSALDVVDDCWHEIESDLLKGRYMYSVASIGMNVYIVGGCSLMETLKEVVVFSPLTNSWRKVSPMKVSRTKPVVGVFEISSSCSILNNQEEHLDREHVKVNTRTRGVSDVYGDPHRLSLRRELRDASIESTNLVQNRKKSSKIVGKARTDQPPKVALIVVGGGGPLDDPLDSGEIYNPTTNDWIEIARLPEGFGSVCSGAVCNGKFYVFSTRSNKLASYDLELGFWVLIETSHPRYLWEYNLELVSCRGRLFMCCVCWSEGDGEEHMTARAVRKLWELDTALHSWAEVSTHPDAPMDKKATIVADSDRIYVLEVFRIFGQVLDFLTSCSVSDSEIEWSRLLRKHAGHEARPVLSAGKSILVLHL